MTISRWENVKTDPGSCPKEVVAVLGSEVGFLRVEWHRWGPQGPRTQAGGRNRGRGVASGNPTGGRAHRPNAPAVML